MNTSDDTGISNDIVRTRLRRGVYWVLIAVSIGSMTGRILAVNSVDQIGLAKYLKRKLERPFLSANDRSRWATVRSLVEYGTYQIDDVIVQPGWDTIDMVKHDDWGRPAPGPYEGHLYSSKPPLLATLMAGEYWIIHKLSDTTLAEHPYAIGRFMLVTLNVLPMLVYFWCLTRLAERIGTSDWGRIFMVACAALATFLSTFSIVITNHLPAAVSAAIALYCAVRIIYDGERKLWLFFVGGLFAAFTAACELPALSFFCLLSAWLLWQAPRQTIAAYLPAALIVAAGALGTNYIAHHTLKPAYAQREGDHNWYKFKYFKNESARANDKDHSGATATESYWSSPEKRSAIDQGEPSPALYAFHALIGHHGIFSLTPIWLISLLGLVMLCFRRGDALNRLGWFILILSVVCVTFYLSRGQEDRNYGGMSSGFRWAFWFAPLWLVAMLPAADWMAGRRGWQCLACLLLGLSVMSVSYPTWNPWVQPWLTDILVDLDWVGLGPR